ncbi:MAG: hypothetical protein F7C09_00715 [Aeropyrum sp.]|nr:hypothetical protein [Aeropyrum sp.]
MDSGRQLATLQLRVPKTLVVAALLLITPIIMGPTITAMSQPIGSEPGMVYTVDFYVRDAESGGTLGFSRMVFSWTPEERLERTPIYSSGLAVSGESAVELVYSILTTQAYGQQVRLDRPIYLAHSVVVYSVDGEPYYCRPTEALSIRGFWLVRGGTLQYEGFSMISQGIVTSFYVATEPSRVETPQGILLVSVEAQGTLASASRPVCGGMLVTELERYAILLVALGIGFGAVAGYIRRGSLINSALSAPGGEAIVS